MHPDRFRQIALRAWFSAAILLCALSAHAFVYTVNDTADAVDADPSDGICATTEDVCTLRAAIQQANAWPGRHTILLPPGTYRLDIEGRGEEQAATGDLDITDDLIIRGAGPGRTTIDAARIDRAFDVRGQDTIAEITGLTIINGLARGGSDGRGGAIRSAGVLTLRDVEIRDNRSEASDIAGGGGGIYHSRRGEDVSLRLERVIISDNEATGETSTRGGGLAVLDSNVEIRHATIRGNRASGGMPPPQGGGDGGGIDVSDGRFFMADSTVADNRADRFGGGLHTFGASPDSLTEIRRSTINGNLAYRGGGIHDDGGGLREGLDLVNTTISDNTAEPTPGTGFTDARGGGLFLRHRARLTNVTLAGNQASEGGALHFDDTRPPGSNPAVFVGNSIIEAGPQGGTCSGATSDIEPIGPNVGSSDCRSSIVEGAQLADLASGRGGPTAVHVPQPGSPAINAGSNAICPETDQRGFPRPIATCDIGAVETGGGVLADLALGVLDFPDPVEVNERYAYTITVANQGPEDATNARLGLQVPAGASVVDPGGCTGTGGTLECVLGSLAAGSRATREVVLRATTEGTLVASLSAAGDEADPVPENSLGIEVTTEAIQPSDLRLAVAARTTGIIVPAGGGAETTGLIGEDDTIIAGQRFTYTLTLDSTGGTARGARIVTTLPEGIAPLAGPAFRVAGGSATPCRIETREIHCDLGDLPEGNETAVITIPARPDERGSKVTRARGNFDGTFVTRPPADDFRFNVDTRADLGVGMTASASPVNVGADLAYVIAVHNAGPSNATAPELQIRLSGNVELGPIAAGSWTCEQEDDLVRCGRESLASGAESTVTVFVVPQAAGEATATATVSGDDTDPDPSNNEATARVLVVEGPVVGPDLALSMLARPDPGVVGENLSLVSTVENIGSEHAERVTLTQSLPRGVAFLFGSDGCTREADFVRCNMGKIIVGTSAAVTIVVRPEREGTLTTSAVAVDASGRDADLTNNERSLSVEVVPPQREDQGLRTSDRCFIATAAWGSPLAPQVAELRRFRDNVLLRSSTGRAFVDWYYEVSPPLAAFIAKHEALRKATRLALTPVVHAVVHPLPTGGLGLLLAAGVAWRLGRRHRTD